MNLLPTKFMGSIFKRVLIGLNTSHLARIHIFILSCISFYNHSLMFFLSIIPRNFYHL